MNRKTTAMTTTITMLVTILILYNIESMQDVIKKIGLSLSREQRK